MFKWSRIVIFSLVFFALSTIVYADYERDQNFGTNGVITQNYSSNEDLGVAIVTDSSSNVYVAGFTQTGAGVYSSILWKYDSSGSLISGWPKTYGSGTDDYISIGMDIDSDDNLYLTGYVEYAADSNIDLYILKYDSAGNLASGFPKTYNSSGVREDYGYLTKIYDNSIYIAGSVDNVSGDNQAAIWKYDLNGNLASGWPKTYSNSDVSSTVDVAVDSEGNIYASGYSDNGSNYDATLWKYDTNGSLVSDFPKVYNSDANDNDYGYGIDIDSNDNIYAVGLIRNGSGIYNAALWKYNTDGILASGFPKTYSAGNGYDAAVMVDCYGSNIYFRGFSENAESEYQTTLWGYDSDGNAISNFPKTYGGESATNYGYGITVDENSNIFVTGSVEGSSTYDMLLIKYITNPATPEASPAGGNYAGNQSVTLTSTGDAVIYYTTDGTDPTTSSSAYSSAITISEDTTLKALACKSQLCSSIMSETYTISQGFTLRGYLRVKGKKFKGKGEVELYSSGGKKLKKDRIDSKGRYRFINLAEGNKYCIEAWAEKRITKEKYEKQKKKYQENYPNNWKEKFSKKYIIDTPSPEKKEKGREVRYYKRYKGKKCFTMSADRRIKLKLR